MSDLLSFADKTNLIRWLSISAIVLLVLVLIIISIFSKRFNTKTIVFAGVSVSASFVLSLIKFSPVTYGGSVTIASFVPIIIFSFSEGFGAGLLCGLVHGLLQFIAEPYLLTPITFILDYILAFIGIAFAGLFKKKLNEMPAIVLGTVLVYFSRFVFAFISGIIYFNVGEIWASLPANSGFLYSFLYQITYLLPDMAISIAVLIILSKTRVITRLIKQIGHPDYSPILVKNSAIKNAEPFDNAEDSDNNNSNQSSDSINSKNK